MRFVNAGRAALQPFQMMVLRDRLKKPLQIDSLLLVLNTNDIFGIDGRVTITSVTDTEVLWKQDVHNEGSLRPLIEPLIKNSALAGWLASRLQVAVAEPEGPPKTGAPRQVSKEKRRILQAFLQHMKKEDEFRILYIPAMSFMGERFSEMTPDAKTAWTVIEEESKSLSIPIINLDRFLIDSFSHSGQPGVGFPNRIVGNIHLNPQGHIAAAKAIKELYQGSCR